MAERKQSSLTVLGCWSARPDQRHTLKIERGRAWVTLTGEWGTLNPDFVLTQGQCLEVAAGQHLVVENWPENDHDQLAIVWYAHSIDPSSRLAKPTTQL